ncbi:hypothetical protein V8F20_001860 [Naviculisporaceae sp. PSN 640]
MSTKEEVKRNPEAQKSDLSQLELPREIEAMAKELAKQAKVEDAEGKLFEAEKRLAKLGPPCPTVSEQRQYLVNVAQSFQRIVRSALAADYHDPFFAAEGRGFAKRLRSVVQNHNIKFYKTMTVSGQKRLVVDVDEGTDTDSLSISFLRVSLISKDEFLDHVKKAIRQTRGLELHVPGTCNLTAVVSELFREQSEEWKLLAETHVFVTWKAACRFLGLVADHITGEKNPKTTAIKEILLDPAMEAVLGDMKNRTEQLLEGNYNTHPITYSPEFAKAMEEKRIRRLGRRPKATKIVRDIFRLEPGIELSDTHALPSGNYDLRALADAMKALSEQDREEAAALEAFDALHIYYDIALKRFIDNMAIQVIEELLLAKLPDLLSPVAVELFEAEKLEKLAGDTEEIKKLRDTLMGAIKHYKGKLEAAKPQGGPVSNPDKDDDEETAGAILAAEELDYWFDQISVGAGSKTLIVPSRHREKTVAGTGGLAKPGQQQTTDPAAESKLTGVSGAGEAEGGAGGQAQAQGVDAFSSPATPAGKKGKKGRN